MGKLTISTNIDMCRYRDQTATQAAMPGVTGPSFVCAGCGQARKTAGRKKLARGWRCAACVDGHGFRKGEQRK